MRELSLHILDLAQNSIEAGAHHVQIDINENEDGYFTFAIADDGRGMTEEMVKKVRDPFVTTRITRKVGMGIPFMYGYGNGAVRRLFRYQIKTARRHNG